MISGQRNFKLTLAYDGSAYHGFQYQSNAVTVQQTLETSLAQLFGEKIRIAGAARTDAGVHAYGQVVSLRTDSPIPADRIPSAVNGLLPRDIAVVAADEVPDTFHARFSAIGKIYQYRILNSAVPNPLLRNYAWQVLRPLQVELMHEAMQVLVGEHDFSAFQASGSSAKHPVRTLYNIQCRRNDDEIEFQFHGNGFLYHMVRNIVGTVVDIGAGKMAEAEFRRVFAGRNRSAAGATAPPQGLYLRRIFYE